MVLQRRLRMLHRANASYDMSIAFLAWARDMVLSEAHEQLWPLRWHTAMELRHTAEALRRTRNTLRQALRTDRTAYVHEVAEKAVTGLPMISIERYKMLVSAGDANREVLSHYPSFKMELANISHHTKLGLKDGGNSSKNRKVVHQLNLMTWWPTARWRRNLVWLTGRIFLR